MLALQFPQQDGWPSRRTSTEHLEREGPQYQDVVPVLVPRDRDVTSARARFLIMLGLGAPNIGVWKAWNYVIRYNSSVCVHICF